MPVGQVMILECVQEGFRTTNRNWQLVLLKMAVSFLNLLGLLFFIGVPLLAAVALLGLDLAQVRDIMPELLRSPGAVVTRYLGILVLLLISLLLYLVVMSVLMLYVFGGTLGVLRSSVLDSGYRFSFASFLQEARRLFFPLLWLFSVTLLFVLVFVAVFGILTVFAMYAVREYGVSGTTVPLFFSYFFGLLLIFSVVIAALVGLILTVYAVLVLALRRGGAVESFHVAWAFLRRKPAAFLFYAVLVVGVVGVNLLFIAAGASFGSVPIVGLMFGIPYRLLSFVLQSYLGVFVWASLFVFYVRGIDESAPGGKTPSYSI